MALLIPATDRARTVTPATGAAFTLAELQGLVGGYIEALRIPDGRYLVCNEDGKRLQLPMNIIATWTLATARGGYDVVVGDALIATVEELGGDVRETAFS